MRIKVEMCDLKQTAQVATSFAELLKSPMIVLLKGDLGSGKTTFVKSVAAALGCRETVTSPTFTLLNTYEGRFRVYHFDMYRLSSAEEARNVGFMEYFDKKTLDGICFVEWPENVEGLINEVDFTIELKKVGDTHRTIIIEGGKE